MLREIEVENTVSREGVKVTTPTELKCHRFAELYCEYYLYCAGIPPLLGSPLGYLLISLSRRFIPPRLCDEHSTMSYGEKIGFVPSGQLICAKGFYVDGVKG